MGIAVIMVENCDHCIVIKEGKRMRLFRYRRPSVKTMLGVTRAKKRFNKAIGLTAVRRPLRAPGNAKRRMLRKMGYYSEPMKFLRFLKRLGR